MREKSDYESDRVRKKSKRAKREKKVKWQRRKYQWINSKVAKKNQWIWIRGKEKRWKRKKL